MPASIVSGNLAGYPSVYFDKQTVPALFANLRFYSMTSKKVQPRNTGVVNQLHTYETLPAATTPISEGTPGAPESLTQDISRITQSEYSNYMTLSKKVDWTGLGDELDNAALTLGYQAALTVDKVINTTVDTVAAADASTQLDQSAGVYMSAELSRQAAAGLSNANGLPFDDGCYMGIISPIPAFDLQNDASAGSWIDIKRYSNPEALETGNVNTGFIGKLGGVSWYTSSVVTTFPSYVQASVLGYGSYVFAKDAFFSSDMGLNIPQSKRAGNKMGWFDAKAIDFTGVPQLTDPAGTTSKAAAYYFLFGVQGRPTGVTSLNVFRRIRTEASI